MNEMKLISKDLISDAWEAWESKDRWEMRECICRIDEFLENFQAAYADACRELALHRNADGYDSWREWTGKIIESDLAEKHFGFAAMRHEKWLAECKRLKAKADGLENEESEAIA